MSLSNVIKNVTKVLQKLQQCRRIDTKYSTCTLVKDEKEKQFNLNERCLCKIRLSWPNIGIFLQ